MSVPTRDVMAAMRDVDGSARDLNLLRPQWPGVDRLLAWLGERYVLSSAHDSHGNDVAPRAGAPPVQERLGATGNAQFIFESPSQSPSHLQVFVAAQEDGSPFVELSFFPQDVAADATAASLLAWAASIQVVAGATGYFLRYENASWRLGDTGEGSGVIAHFSPATSP